MLNAEHEHTVATEKAIVEKHTSDIRINPPKNVLLYGEPSTGKTLLAKAVANSTSTTVLRDVGIELIQQHLGDAPKWVRKAFRVVDDLPQSIVVIEDINAVCTKRYDALSESEVTLPTIDYSEFITTMIPLNRVENEHHLYTPFEKFDKDMSASREGPVGFAAQGFCRYPLEVGFTVTYKIDVEMLSRIQTSVGYWLDIVPIDMAGTTKMLNSKKWGRLPLAAAMPFDGLREASLTARSPKAAAIVAAKKRDETLEDRGRTTVLRHQWNPVWLQRIGVGREVMSAQTLFDENLQPSVGFLALLLLGVTGRPLEDLVVRLPGQPKVNYRQFAGYITVVD